MWNSFFEVGSSFFKRAKFIFRSEKFIFQSVKFIFRSVKFIFQSVEFIFLSFCSYLKVNESSCFNFLQTSHVCIVNSNWFFPDIYIMKALFNDKLSYWFDTCSVYFMAGKFKFPFLTASRRSLTSSIFLEAKTRGHWLKAFSVLLFKLSYKWF